jgi:hypothetical protein
MVYQLDLNSCTFDFALSSCLSLPSVYVYCVYPIMSKSIKKKKMQNFTIKEQKQASFWSFSMVSITSALVLLLFLTIRST